jgi:hypothetical protein
MIEGIRKVITGRGYPRLLLIVREPFYRSGFDTFYGIDFVKDNGFNFKVMNSMLLQSFSNGHRTFAKVINYNESENKIQIDFWTNGIPADGERFEIVGWCVDLGYSQEIKQIFIPFIIKHELYNGRVIVKQLGFKYRCEISFEKFFPSDILIGLVKGQFILNKGLEDVQMVLIPHIDKPGFNYNVFLESEINLIPTYKEGYSGTRFVFVGKELVNLPVEYGYGANYGYQYGICL